MNRTTVLILALVLFLAHILAMHHDSTGAFALPADVAHVNFHVARNFVHAQGSVWGPGTTPAAILEEGATSLLWTLLAAGAELAAWSPVRVASTAGILAALLGVAFVSRLSRERLVGVTATALLVVSGPLASTAADGTETACFTMLVALAFLSLERRRAKWLGGSLAFLVLTRSVGILWVLGFLVAALSQRRGGGPRMRLSLAFLPALFVWLGIGLARLGHDVSFLTPDLAAVLAFDTEAMRVGAWSLEALVRGAIAPLLLLLPIAQFALGKLSGTGRRALGLAFVGSLVIVLGGGSSRPMHAAWVPVLPLFYLAVQEGILSGLDRRPKHEWLAWVGLSAACLGSVLASKIPGDLGPLRTRELLEGIARNNATLEEAWGAEWNGRPSLTRDLRASERLRALGLFFRDHNVPPDAVVLTPRPGAIGYLSDRRVVDLLGRAVAPAGRPTNSWNGRVRADVVAALERGPDYVVPMVTSRKTPPTQDELVDEWLRRYDNIGPLPERRAALIRALEAYELVAVPIPARERNLSTPDVAPAYLLRRHDLGLAPELSIIEKGSRFRIHVKHSGHHQIAELEVRATDASGAIWTMRPNGSFARDQLVRARTETLLFPTGDRDVELVWAELASELCEGGQPKPGVVLTARLLNPFCDPSDAFAQVCEPVRSEH